MARAPSRRHDDRDHRLRSRSCERSSGGGRAELVGGPESEPGGADDRKSRGRGLHQQRQLPGGRAHRLPHARRTLERHFLVANRDSGFRLDLRGGRDVPLRHRVRRGDELLRGRLRDRWQSWVAPGRSSNGGTAASGRASPRPVSASNAALNAVACSSASMCHAVGNNEHRAVRDALERLVVGKVAIPKPAGATHPTLSGIKCTAAKNCIAVGSYTSPNASNATKTLVERWNGTKWTHRLEPESQRARTSSSLGRRRVPDFVVVLRRRHVHRPRRISSARSRSAGTARSGRSSRARARPATRRSLRSACRSVSSCTAVGTKGNVDARRTVERHEVGDRVESQPVGRPQQRVARRELPGDDRVLRRRRRRVRRERQPPSLQRAMERLRVEDASEPGRRFGEPAARRGVRDFHFLLRGRHVRAHRSGDHSRLPPAVGRDGVDGGRHTGPGRMRPRARSTIVTCVSTMFCVAVGSAIIGSQKTLIEQWNGSTWTVAPVAVAGSLAGVACADATHCAAVGTSGGQTLVEQWNGTSWTTASGAVAGALDSVSCADASNCMAVGVINLPNSPVLRWNGATWTAVNGVVPAGSDHEITPTGVACAAAADCVLVGHYRDMLQSSVRVRRPLGRRLLVAGRRCRPRASARCPTDVTCVEQHRLHRGGELLPEPRRPVDRGGALERHELGDRHEPEPANGVAVR